MNLNDVLALLNREIAEAGSQLAWAKRHAISQPYVGDVLHRRREPGKRILDALGLEKVVTYRKLR